MSKRKEIFEKCMNNESPERVPVAFWHHFVPPAQHHMALHDPKVMQTVRKGQKEYYQIYKPDVMKIMSDGFFGHPAMHEKPITSVDGIKDIKSCGPNHPFITEQVQYVKEMVDFVDGEVYTYYNIFAPLNYIRLKFEEFDGEVEKFPRLFLEDPEAMFQAGQEIGEYINILIDRIFEETNVDGIYYSVQAVQDERADKAFHDRFVRPLDMMVIERILKYTDNIFLHICGYGDFTNPLEWYVEYPAKIINWATHNEKVSLAEGKKIFNGKPVIGGFNNNPGTELYVGTKEEIQKTVHDILAEAGTKGVAIGADCTISQDFDPERIHWILEAVENF